LPYGSDVLAVAFDMFNGKYSKSLGPKILIVIVFSFVMMVIGLSMFCGSEQVVPLAMTGNRLRQIILFIGLVIYALRMLVALFVFLKRRMSWGEGLLVSIVMSLVVFALAYYGGNQKTAVGVVDYIGIVLYLCGSFLHSCSEFQRYAWKQRAENRGHLFTGGLFRYSMHMNYFGDVLLFTGLALITRVTAMFVIPLFMALNFAAILIPSLDAYLARKYSTEFTAYASKAKKFIPFVY
jgi:protein-S-isoprenylcysteine O-methyltransferase Ste14